MLVEEAVWDVGVDVGTSRIMVDPGWWFGFYQSQLQTAIVSKSNSKEYHISDLFARFSVIAKYG